MNHSNDHGDTPEELRQAYERASRADGSRPSLSTRASILATARCEAAARATATADAVSSEGGAPPPAPRPAAANDARFHWRAVAGLAGVAFAAVLALRMYRDNPEPSPQPAAVMPAPAQEPVQAPALAPVPEEPATDSANVAPTAAAPVEPSPAAGQALRAERATERPASADRAAAVLLVAPSAGRPSAEMLLQEAFPQALDSDSAARQYWFVLDRQGNIVLRGQRAWSDLAALRRWAVGELPAMQFRRIESVHWLNRRGRDIEVAYLWVDE